MLQLYGILDTRFEILFTVLKSSIRTVLEAADRRFTKPIHEVDRLPFEKRLKFIWADVEKVDRLKHIRSLR